MKIQEFNARTGWIILIGIGLLILLSIYELLIRNPGAWSSFYLAIIGILCFPFSVGSVLSILQKRMRNHNSLTKRWIYYALGIPVLCSIPLFAFYGVGGLIVLAIAIGLFMGIGVLIKKIELQLFAINCLGLLVVGFLTISISVEMGIGAGG